MTPDAPDPSLGVLERVPCPACAEPVLPAARKCRWCNEWFGQLWMVSGEERSAPMLADLADPFARPATATPGREPKPQPVMEPDRADITPGMLRVDAITLEVGSDIARAVDPDVDGALLRRLVDVRQRVALEFGVIVPGVRIRPNHELEAGEYRIHVKGDLIAEGHVKLGSVMAIGADLDVPNVAVEHTTDPIYGTPAVWIAERHESLAVEHGLQAFDAFDVIATHAAEVIKQHLAAFLTREEVAELLNMARHDSPMVVQELVPNMLALGQLRQVLQNLVEEQIPIKDLSTILNALADNAVYTKDPHTLTEHVRQAMGRRICSRYQGADGMLRAFMLSPDAERAIQNAIQLNETGQVLMLDPARSQAIQNNLAEALGRHRGSILDPVVVVPPKIRRHVKALLERHFAKIVVLSYSEIVRGVQVENLEMIGLHPAGAGPSPEYGPHRQHPMERGASASGGDWLVDPDPDRSLGFGSGANPSPHGPHDARDWNW